VVVISWTIHMEMKNISSAQDVICLSFKVIKHEEAEFEELEEE